MYFFMTEKYREARELEEVEPSILADLPRDIGYRTQVFRDFLENNFPKVDSVVCVDMDDTIVELKTKIPLPNAFAALKGLQQTLPDNVMFVLISHGYYGHIQSLFEKFPVLKTIFSLSFSNSHLSNGNGVHQDFKENSLTEMEELQTFIEHIGDDVDEMNLIGVISYQFCKAAKQMDYCEDDVHLVVKNLVIPALQKNFRLLKSKLFDESGEVLRSEIYDYISILWKEVLERADFKDCQKLFPDFKHVLIDDSELVIKELSELLPDLPMSEQSGKKMKLLAEKYRLILAHPKIWTEIEEVKSAVKRILELK